jgi:protein-S-isoprenylcysteine O-methyltransferase Ste14
VLVFKWSRGVLAMSAALAVLLAVLSIVASTGWFSRDQTGFSEPLIPAAILGLIYIVLVPVLLLLVAFAMRGFNQAWNIEVAVPEEEAKENLADKFDESGRRVQHEDENRG